MNEGRMSAQGPSERIARIAAMAAGLTLALVLLATPSQALAGCPGCGEYKLDLPDKTGSQQVEPEPAAPPPVSAPATTSPTTTTTPVPTTTAEPEEEKEPAGPDPKHAVEPVSLTPVVPASEVEASSSFPLLALLAAIGGLGAVAGLIRRRAGRRTGKA